MIIESYFTKKDDVRKIILSQLDKAKHKIFIAVAWFTDKALFKKVLELQDSGVSVELIITKHEFNTQSSNDYSLIIDKGGFFAEIGNDDQLMHMKFCVIDYGTVISGSANWSNRAFTVNNEEVTLVSGNIKRANDFVAEFERLKSLSGYNDKNEEILDLSKVLKYFKLIKAFIDIGEVSNIQPYVHQLKKTDEVNHIVDLLMNSEYDAALSEINRFEKNNNQLIDISAYERNYLISQIKLFSYQIEALEIEKAEAESIVEQFNHRYIIELNPLLSKILALKKKIYDKLKKHGIVDDTYEKLAKEFKEKNEEYIKEKDINIPDLSDEEEESLKKIYRDAVKYCHPESHSCIYKDKKEAAKVFDELTRAYKANDIEKARMIWNELKFGNPISSFSEYDELEHLRAKLASLKEKYNYLFQELSSILSSETYHEILSIDDWNEYFTSQKILIENEFKILNEKYVNHEQQASKKK